MITTKNSSSFYTIGISYKKADASLRGKFSLGQSQQEALLEKAKSINLEGLLVLSTCNRTEIYGFAAHPFELISLLCQFSLASVEDFENVGYVYKNQIAVEHFFKMATGLDSQILGDFEIVNQVKQSYNLSASKQLSNAFLKRMVDSSFLAGKRIKNQTQISSGATSVAFAAVKYLLNQKENTYENILLYGTGSIGRNTCENLVKHTANKSITLINRTQEKANEIAGKYQLIVKPFENLESEIQASDVLIVATGAQNPTINASMIAPEQKLLILDLSMPRNVSSEVMQLPNVKVLHLDDFSKITDDTLQSRQKELPLALEILSQEQEAFLNWANSRKFTPTIVALKNKLEIIKQEELNYLGKKFATNEDFFANEISNRIIHKITTLVANHLKESDNIGVERIERMFKLETIKE